MSQRCGVQNSADLSVIWGFHSHYRVCGKVSDSHVQLARITQIWEPVLVDKSKLLDALNELISVEQREIDMVR